MRERRRQGDSCRLADINHLLVRNVPCCSIHKILACLQFQRAFNLIHSLATAQQHVKEKNFELRFPLTFLQFDREVVVCFRSDVEPLDQSARGFPFYPFGD